MENDQSIGSRLLMLAVSIAGTMVLVWLELPPDQRMTLGLEAKTRFWGWLNRAARRAGRAGMGSELSGWRQSAAAGYGLAYRRSQARDRLT